MGSADKRVLAFFLTVVICFGMDWRGGSRLWWAPSFSRGSSGQGLVLAPAREASETGGTQVPRPHADPRGWAHSCE
jgi:hypothetical protein